MLNLENFLVEFLDKPLDYKIDDENHSRVKAMFYIGDNSYLVSVGGSTTASVSFATYTKGSDHRNIKVLNSGSDAKKVYATVGKIVMDFIDKRPMISAIEFLSYDSRTQKTYAMIARKIEAHLKKIGKKNVRSASNEFGEFMIGWD